jgi:hypothetical protein
MKDCKITKDELKTSKMPLRQTLAAKGGKITVKKPVKK